jgi:hypothetical protein
MAAKTKKDESVAAKLGSEPEEGVGSGAYSEFLHQWAVNVSAVYQRVPSDDGCTPVYEVTYQNGHVLGDEPRSSCGAETDRAFHEALEKAERPPMPTSFANQQITIMFYDTGKK